tara:strand:+ start:2362 stop:2655 length:294 start_codon:yes stop_codon:yes gene_type:complete
MLFDGSRRLVIKCALDFGKTGSLVRFPSNNLTGSSVLSESSERVLNERLKKLELFFIKILSLSGCMLRPISEGSLQEKSINEKIQKSITDLKLNNLN